MTPQQVGRPSPVCLAGVGTADATWQEPTFPDAIKAARLEAVKLVPPANTTVYGRLRDLGIKFVMVRLNWKPNPAWAGLAPSDRMSTAVKDFLDATREQFNVAHDNGVRYFEVHNEPNMPANPTDEVGDGLGTAWMGPGEFAEWFSRVADKLHEVHGDALLGFPGLSPKGKTDDVPGSADEVDVGGQKLLWSTDKWLAICKSTIEQKADWIGVHCYWQAEGSGRFGIENAMSGGMYWQRYQKLFPGKLLFITEFSNNLGDVPPAVKGRQYAQYFRMLRNQKAIGAAFAFALFWKTDPNREGWVFETEDGKIQGRGIADELGRALAANPI